MQLILDPGANDPPISNSPRQQLVRRQVSVKECTDDTRNNPFIAGGYPYFATFHPNNYLWFDPRTVNDGDGHYDYIWSHEYQLKAFARSSFLENLALWPHYISLPHFGLDNVLLCSPMKNLEPQVPAENLNIDNQFWPHVSPYQGTLPPSAHPCVQLYQNCEMNYIESCLYHYQSPHHQLNSQKIFGSSQAPSPILNLGNHLFHPSHMSPNYQNFMPMNHTPPSPSASPIIYCKPIPSKRWRNKIDSENLPVRSRKKIQKVSSRPKANMLKLAVRHKLRELSASQLEKVHSLCEQFFENNLTTQEDIPIQTTSSLLVWTNNQLVAGKSKAARKYLEFLLLDWKELPDNISLLQTILMQN